MKWREPITLTVRILSPVVIGTGERCNPMGFFVADDGRVWVVDERKFIEVLIERGLAEGFRIWLEGQLQQNRRPNLKGFFDAKKIQQKRGQRFCGHPLRMFCLWSHRDNACRGLTFASKLLTIALTSQEAN
jgi:hypothetical protein